MPLWILSLLWKYIKGCFWKWKRAKHFHDSKYRNEIAKSTIFLKNKMTSKKTVVVLNIFLALRFSHSSEWMGFEGKIRKEAMDKFLERDGGEVQSRSDSTKDRKTIPYRFVIHCAFNPPSLLHQSRSDCALSSLPLPQTVLAFWK